MIQPALTAATAGAPAARRLRSNKSFFQSADR